MTLLSLLLLLTSSFGFGGSIGRCLRTPACPSTVPVPLRLVMLRLIAGDVRGGCFRRPGPAPTFLDLLWLFRDILWLFRDILWLTRGSGLRGGPRPTPSLVLVLVLDLIPTLLWVRLGRLFWLLFGFFLVLRRLNLTRSASSSASVRAKRASSSSDIRALRPTDGVRPLSGTYHEVVVPPGDAPR